MHNQKQNEIVTKFLSEFSSFDKQCSSWDHRYRYWIDFTRNALIHFLTFTPTNWFLFVRYLSYNLLYLSNMIVVPLLKTIFRSNTWKNDGLQKQMFLTLIAFSHVFHLFLAIYFSRSSQSSSCYQQRQQLLQWPLQCHVECAQLFRNLWISDLLQKGYSKYYLLQKLRV